MSHKKIKTIKTPDTNLNGALDGRNSQDVTKSKPFQKFARLHCIISYTWQFVCSNLTILATLDQMQP